MAAKRITVYRLEVEDRPGALQKFLSRAAAEGVDFECFVAFSAGSGMGVAYLAAKDGAALLDCAQKAGVQATAAAGFIIAGADKAGAAAQALQPLGAAGINAVAGSAMVCDGSYHMLIITEEVDGDAAEKALSG